MHDADIDGLVSALERVDPDSGAGRIDDEPEDLVLGVGGRFADGSDQKQVGRTHPRRRGRGSGEHPACLRRPGRDTTRIRQQYRCRLTAGQPRQHRTLRLGLVGELGERAGDDRRHQRAWQHRGRGGLEHAGTVQQRAALPADLIGQVNRVKPVDDELIPPLRQFTAGHRVECLAGLVDRRVTLRELGHGFGQLLLFGSQRDRHRGPPTGAAGRRVSWKNSAASSMASGVGRGFQPSSETALE